MVVRDKVGRKRYIVLSVNTEGSPSHEDFEREVVSLLRDRRSLRSVRPKLMDFDGKVGVIRCAHVGKDELIEVLTTITVVSGQRVQVETVKTSGTLRRARAIAESLASSR